MCKSLVAALHQSYLTFDNVRFSRSFVYLSKGTRCWSCALDGFCAAMTWTLLVLQVGMETEGFAIYDAMQNVKNEV